MAQQEKKMKNNKKLLLALVCIMLVSIALWIAAVNLSKESSEPDDAGEPLTVVKSYDIEKISAFTLYGTDDEKSFTKTDGTWVYADDENFPLDDAFVDNALEIFSQISAVSVVEENASDLTKYGLDEPQMRAEITDENGKGSFLIGDYNSFSGCHYMCEEGVGDIFQIDTALVDLCSKEEEDIIELDTLPGNLSGDKVTEVQIGELTLKDGDEGFEDIKNAVSSLSLEDYADYYLADEEREKYGLASPTKVFIKYAESVDSADDSPSTVTSAVYYDYTLYIGVPVDRKIFFTPEDSNIVYRMDADVLAALIR